MAKRVQEVTKRIIGMMVCGPNEKYLKGSLDEFKRLCDDAIIATNNADKDTIALIKSYGFWTYEDNREWGIYQPIIKQDLLRKIGHLAPDWVIALDADEKFAPEFTREVAESLMDRGEVAWHFLVVNLYNDTEHFAHDVGIQRFWNIRYFKYLPRFGLEFQKKSLHCGLAPPFAYKYGWNAPFYLEHYGLLLKEDRDRKISRYAKYDPNSKFKDKAYYNDLGRELLARPFNRSELLLKLSSSPECAVRDTPATLKELIKNT